MPAAALVLLGMLVLPPATTRAQGGTGIVRVVPSGGSTASDCGSAGAPCASIQLAVDVAQSGDEVWLASGTYTGGGSAVVVLTADKSLTIIGGFDSATWQRDEGGDATYIDGGNARRGVLIEDTFSSVTFENLTIRNGLANARYGAWGAMGGGMVCFSNASVSLTDVTFSNNRVQGPDTATVGGGGAAFLWGGAGATCPVAMNNVVFDGNQVQGGNGSPRGGQAHGGGFYATYSAVEATNLTLRNNTVTAGSGGVGYSSATWNRADALGGGASLQNNSVSITGLTATGNTATGGAGSQYGGFCNGGGLFFEYATATVTSATFESNRATGGVGTSVEGGVGGGGGLMSQGTALTLERVSFLDNLAVGGAGADGGDAGGGAMYLSRATTSNSGRVSATNAVFAGNRAEAGAGANRWGGGGAIFDQNVTLDLVHATLVDNSVLSTMRAPAIVVLNYLGSSRLNATYSIFADHTGSSASEAAIFAQNPGTVVTLDYTLFHGNTVNTATSDGASLSNTHALAGEPDPLFISPGSPDHDYHVAHNSPVIDQATGSGTSEDIDGQVRPYGDVADVGADEYFPALAASTKRATPATIRAEEGGPNHTISYSIVLRNASATTVSASLEDVLPTPSSPLGLELLSGSCSSGDCNFDTGADAVTWSGDVAASGAVTISYDVEVYVPTDFTGVVNIANIASLSYTGGVGSAYVDDLAGQLIVNPYRLYLPAAIH